MDEERILIKFRELDGYLEEFETIMPGSIEEYENSIEKKRACERLLQISIECLIDISNIVFSELRLGMPSDEDDVLKSLEEKDIISKSMFDVLIEMKGMRNLLVHKYGKIDNARVFEAISEHLGDFEKFREEILNAVHKIKTKR